MNAKKILLTRPPDQWLAAERALRQGLGERLTDSQAGLTTEPTTTTENLVTIGMLRHAKGTLAGCVPGILTQGLVGSFARRQDTLDWIGLSNSPQLCQLQSGLLQKVVFFFGRRPATIRRRRPLHAFFHHLSFRLAMHNKRLVLVTPCLGIDISIKVFELCQIY